MQGREIPPVGRSLPRYLRLSIRVRQQRPTHSKRTPKDDTVGIQLPHAPTDTERDAYWQPHVRWLLIGTVSALIATLIAATRLMLVAHVFLPYFVITAGMSIIGALTIWGYMTFNHQPGEAHRRLVEEWAPDRHPSVDVWLPICNEPHAVLRNTWRHVAELDWPGALQVTVLDDAGDAAVEALAAEFGFRYLARPNRGWMKKAGNLQYAYRQSAAEFATIFDADFCPRPDFLLELMPYFDDPELGIVQSPQYFEVTSEQNWLQRGAGAVQELFYRGIQPGRQRRGAAVCVGTCAVYRRAALDSNGGTTLIGHSEDVHTGFDLGCNGWKLRYVPVVLAMGICPSDVGSFFRQQYRWCVGSMSLVTSRKFWAANLPLRARVCYVGGFGYYVSTALTVLIGPALPLVLLLWFPELIHLRNYLLLAPVFIWRFVVFPRWHRCKYGMEACTVQLLYGWAHLFALVDVARGRPMGWKPTGTVAGRELRERMLLGAVLLWSGTLSVAWFVLAALRDHGSPANFLPMMALGAFYITVVGRVFIPNRPPASA
jgi:cellulose synthase (UDP-forming)